MREGLALYCDAMLGGLARWLRAAGYDARFQHGIDDGDLVNRTRDAGGVLLSSDGPLFERQPLRNGTIRSLYVPRGLDIDAQLAFVLRELRLPLAEPRCMACGGSLDEVAKGLLGHDVPARTLAFCNQFWRCARCGQVFWHGTHWLKIAPRLAAAAARSAIPW
jgi:uncharacterized protein with PIN domain